MPHDRVRTNHDELSQIAQLFAQEAEAVSKTLQSLRQRKDVLQGGDWVGQAATRFYQEMDSEILPTLGRLQRALAQAQQVTRTIGTRLRQCEADAARQLQDREAFTGQPVGGSGGSLPATGGDFTGQPVGGSGGSLPQTGGDFTGQPVGGSGGSLPATGGDFTGQPVGGSGGSLPATDDGYSIGGTASLGPISVEGEISAFDGSTSDTGTFGQTAEGHVLGSEVEIGLDPFGVSPLQSAISGEGVLLGGEAGFGVGPGLVGGFAEGTVGSAGGEVQLGGGEDGWARNTVQVDIVSGGGFIGFHEGDIGLGGSVSAGSISQDFVVGTRNIGITFGGEFTGPGADGAVGFADNRLALEGGVEGVGVSGGAGLNVLGWNVTVGGEAEVGLHFGGSIGKRTAIHLGPFSGVITIGSAK
ncbi:MAG: WXG100 family type VII secretion target [Anaerolineales bacterium]|nr:WXG100 family type VII secretion target [Anaerolineales bacterium]